MALDISLTGNVMKVTVDSNQPVCYNKATRVKYFFNAAGTKLEITFTEDQVSDKYTSTLAALTVSGVNPATAPAAYTALQTVIS